MNRRSERPGFIVHSLSVTMSQKSSIPQATNSVSQLLTADSLAVRPIGCGAVCSVEPPTWQINPKRVAQRVS